MTSPLRSSPPLPKRWWKFLRRANGRRETFRTLVCPRGHAIPANAVISETGFIRCDTRANIGGVDHRHQLAPSSVRGSVCNTWIFVFAIVGGGAVVAEVSLEEVEQMNALRTPSDMLDYLQIWPDR